MASETKNRDSNSIASNQVEIYELRDQIIFCDRGRDMGSTTISEPFIYSKISIIANLRLIAHRV